MVQAAVTSETSLANCSEEADAFILPYLPYYLGKQQICLCKSVAEAIVPYLRKGKIVVLEFITSWNSENLLVPILERSGLKAGEDLLVAHS